MNICENIIVGSRLFPQRVAIISGNQQLTYDEIERLSGQAAHVLQNMGVERGDRVGIVIPNVSAFVIWYYAGLRLGAIVVSISTRLSSDEVAFILNDCQARVVVGTDALVELLDTKPPVAIDQIVRVSEDALQVGEQPLGAGDSMGEGVFAEMEPEEPATILYTSGTTGFPKGATLSHQNVRATMHAFNHLCQMQPGDRLLLAVPLFHCYGQNALLNAGLNVGATLVLQRRFDLNESKQLILDHQVTMLLGVPTTFQFMLDSCDAADLASIRYCFSAAAKLPEQLSHAWLEKFRMPIHEGYGLTETAPFASYNHRLRFVPGSIGTPVDLVEMKIVDPDTGRTCPPHVPGEIAIRGPNVMLGYWNRPGETAAAIRDGWFYSGDIGLTDEHGYFYIVDRLKDMIVVGGLKVFPAEVERVLLDHPAVSEAAVVGFTDPVLGEKVVAFVVQANEAQATQHEIRAHCQGHLGAYKVPGRVVFIEQLPRNPAGKVLKTKLRNVELPNSEDEPAPDETANSAIQKSQSLTSISPAPIRGQLIERLRNTHLASRQRFLTSFVQDELRALTGHAEVPNADELIMNAELDSLMVVEFRDRLQIQLGAHPELPSTLVFDYPRLSDLVAHLLKLLELDGEAAARPVEAAANDRPTPVPRQDFELQLEAMSEQQAMEALLREVNE